MNDQKALHKRGLLMGEVPHCDNCGEYPGHAVSEEIERQREAGRLMFHAILDRVCNGGSEADDGKSAERIDAAISAWAKADPEMQKYYRADVVVIAPKEARQ